MTTLLKVLLMATAWLVFTLATFHMCVKPTCCAEIAHVNTQQPIPASTLDSTITYTLPAITDPAATRRITTGNDWPTRLRELQKAYADNPEQALQVYGNYYAAEPKPENFPNAGFRRAEEVKSLLTTQTNIPADKVRTLARLIPAPAPAQTFEGARLIWEGLDAGINQHTGNEEAQIVQLDRDNIEIRFPYNAATKTLDPGTERYLRQLAERITSTNEHITITGHTDNRGSDKFNLGLGHQRADFVKKRLLNYGASPQQISTQSQGERQPADRGDTEGAHRRNRRAAITLDKH